MSLEKALKIFKLKKKIICFFLNIFHQSFHLFLYNWPNLPLQKLHELIQYSDFSEAGKCKICLTRMFPLNKIN